MSAIHKELLLQGNAAIAAGNYEGFLALCTDNTRWVFVGDQILQGKQAVREYMAATYLEPPLVTVDQLIGEGDFLTATGSITMTDKDGTRKQFAYCDVWRFEKNKMAAVTAFVIGMKEST